MSASQEVHSGGVLNDPRPVKFMYATYQQAIISWNSISRVVKQIAWEFFRECTDYTCQLVRVRVPLNVACLATGLASLK